MSAVQYSAKMEAWRGSKKKMQTKRTWRRNIDMQRKCIVKSLVGLKTWQKIAILEYLVYALYAAGNEKDERMKMSVISLRFTILLASTN